MPIPDYETLMLTVLAAFSAGAESVRDCLPIVRESFGVTDEEADEMLPSGSTTIMASRVHWARTYLSKAGLLESPKRGVHRITPAGKRVLASGVQRIDNAYLRAHFPAFDEWISATRRAVREQAPLCAADPALQAIPAVAPEEAIAKAVSELAAGLREELLDLVRSMDPLGFERLVLRLLEAMGYGASNLGARLTTKTTGDGGIDGIIHEDALGLDAVYVQAKRYSADSAVGRPALQQFVGSLTGEGATKGVFVTTSRFSTEARDFLRRVQHRVVLIDGEELARLMLRHNVGVRVLHTYEIKAIDENMFADL